VGVAAWDSSTLEETPGGLTGLRPAALARDTVMTAVSSAGRLPPVRRLAGSGEEPWDVE